MRRPGWRHRGAPLLALALAAALSVGVAAVVLHQGSDPGPARPPHQAVLGAATAATVDRCDDALVLTVDGGGERARSPQQPGRTVDVFLRAVRRHAAASGRTVQHVGVALRTEPPRALVGDRPRTDKAKAAVTPRRVRIWRKPVAAGVDRALAALSRAALDCPDQQVLLVGYAHGASVVHRVLGALRGRPDVLPRVAGAALVSDPDRQARSVAAPVGAPAAGPGRRGVFGVLGTIADVPGATPTFEVVNVCTARDLVCDPANNPVREALRLARSYRTGPGAGLVRSAARTVWRRALLRPVPRPEIQVVTAAVDQPLTLQLGVHVLPEAATGVEWTDAQQLPPGFSLTPDGLLTGTPASYGTWNITYVVRGTTPLTTGARGVVVLTVAAESAGVSAGGQTSCETRTDGSAWCWGRNSYGQLGDGTTSTSTQPRKVAGGSVWAALSTSGSTTCGVRRDGTLWCWGLNNFGQLGIGRGKPRSTPVQVGASPAWTSVSTSWFHTCATRRNGTLWCWGSNLRGQLGDGTFEHRGAPTRVGTDRDWVSVSTGGYYTCGTRTDASAWCWGQNAFGQLANANASPQPRPVRVPGQQAWAQLSAGWAHTCGVTVEGAGWCWGLNRRGQLGDGSVALRRAPVAVSGDRIWTTLSVGDATSCGVDNTGAAWCWGSNSYTQLGDGGKVHRKVPVLVSSERPWLSVDAGWFHECGTGVGGGIACWGNNELGQVGNGSHSDQPVPEEVR
ncbi:MAG: cutinase family protein [Nocardioides sp.]|nr:cutinase family protein [Nocardioides sp.]